MENMDTSTMYWETYDDQDGTDFDYLSYVGLDGRPRLDAIGMNIAMQVAEIRRVNGQNTDIRVYRR